MITKIKNKLESNTKNKILVLGLMLLVGVGLFGSMAEVSAQAETPPPKGFCSYNVFNVEDGSLSPFRLEITHNECTEKAKEENVQDVRWKGENTIEEVISHPTGETAIERNLKSCSKLLQGDFDGCFIKLVYYVFYAIPSFFLTIAASFFNFILALALSNKMIEGSSFVPAAWAIVRDLSNIFFILILLYIAIKMILNLGGHEAKKMITQVIIMALLINFSMFFTKVIIDSSNILALVFYNKMETKTTVLAPDGVTIIDTYIPISDPAKTGYVEKNISGGLAKSFKPGDLLTDEFFTKAKEQTHQISMSWAGFGVYTLGAAKVGSIFGTPLVGGSIGAGIGAATYLGKSIVGYFVGTDEVPTPMMIGIILISGLIMIFATAAFFIAGLSFLGRLIELWILIIFSPFAFMSFSVPILGHVEYIGWNAWFKRLLTVSFMAPIFMFFMYFIFLLVNANIFNDFIDRTATKDQGTVEAIILTFVPALVILVLLKKATEFAKKGSGALGEMLIKGAGIVTGVAGGFAIGAGASALQGSLGHLGKGMFENKRIRDWALNEEKGIKGGAKRLFGSGLRNIGGGDDGKGGIAGSSFDLRKGVMGGALKLASTATGINLGGQSKFLLKEEGGYVADLKRRDEKRKRVAKGFEIQENDDLKQGKNAAEEDLEEMSAVAEHEIEELKHQIESARTKLDDLTAKANTLKDTDDPIKVAERRRELDAARLIPDKKEAADAVNVANAMDVSSPEKVEAYRLAREEEKKASDVMAGLKKRLSTIEDANGKQVDSLGEAMKEAVRAMEKTAKAAETAAKAAEANPAGTINPDTNKSYETEAKDAADKATDAKRAFHSAEVALRVAEVSKTKKGASISGLKQAITEIEHKITVENKKRRRRYAVNLVEGFNFPQRTAEIKKSAHEIRMGAQPESHKEEKHGGSDLVGEIVSEYIAEVVTPEKKAETPKQH